MMALEHMPLSLLPLWSVGQVGSISVERENHKGTAVTLQYTNRVHVCVAANDNTPEAKQLRHAVLKMFVHLHAQLVTPIARECCPPAATVSQFEAAAEQDQTFLTQCLLALATGTVPAGYDNESAVGDPHTPDMKIVAFIAKEMMLKVTHAQKVNTLQGFMGTAADIMSTHTFKRLLSKYRIAADYKKLRVELYNEIKLEPDATASFRNSNGDIIIVTFDNIGYHIKGRNCGYYDTVHIVYTVVPAGKLRTSGYFSHSREKPEFSTWDPYPEHGPVIESSGSGSGSGSGSSSGSGSGSSRIERYDKRGQKRRKVSQTPR